MSVPNSLMQRFEEFANFQLKMVTLINVALESLHRFPAHLNLVEAVQEAKRSRGEAVDDKYLKNARENDAPLIREEVEKGFPFFYSMSAVAIWSAIEAFVEDQLSFCIEADPKLLEKEQIQRIKIPFAQYESMTPEERRYFVIDSVERDIQSKYKQGVSQFESVLEVFGLGGEVDDIARKTLLELCNVRNVLVHRDGVADKRLINTCPWLGLSIGQSVHVNTKMYVQYLNEAGIYCATVFARMVRHFGDESKRADKFIAHLSKSRKKYGMKK